jgi:Carboxypeptidase activation peptide
MKLTGVFALFALALPAVAVPVRDHTTGYDGIKVLRIPTGNSTAKLDAFVESLDLNIWTHSVRPNSHLDVEVPKNVYKTFTSGINKLLKEEGITYPVEVMHEDLGVSIRKEAEGLVTADQFTIQGLSSFRLGSLHRLML